MPGAYAYLYISCKVAYYRELLTMGNNKPDGCLEWNG